MKRVTSLLAVFAVVAATAVPAFAHPIHHGPIVHYYPVHYRPMVVVGAPVVDYMFYIRQGDALNGQGSFDAAIASYTQAIALDPYRALGFQRRAAVYSEEGNPAQALADNNQANVLLQSAER